MDSKQTTADDRITRILTEVLNLGRDLEAHAAEASGTPAQQQNYDALCEFVNVQMSALSTQLLAVGG